MPRGLRRPREPRPGECCGSGCARCVWDVYYDALSQYEAQKGAGDSTDEESSTDEGTETDSDSDDGCAWDYIGAVVLKSLPETGKVKAEETLKWVLEDLHTRYLSVSRVQLVRSSGELGGDASSAPIAVLELELPTASFPSSLPGDVVELLVPNDEALSTVDPVGCLCTRLAVNPESMCELHRSPFVPEEHFPPWLPLRQPLTIRQLLTYYVDITSCSYLLHPTFFQSLLRIHRNHQSRQAGGQLSDVSADVAEKQRLLEECASPDSGPQIFRAIQNGGKPLCFPCLTDVLDVFSFVRLPLERLLEMSGPLRPRKFSVAGDKALEEGKGCRCLQLCLRQVTEDRTRYTNSATSAGSAYTLAKLLNEVADRRWRAGEEVSRFFRGHVSFPLTQAAALPGSHAACPFFLGTSLLGTTSFAKELRRAVVDATRAGHSPRWPHVFLIGAGTGIAPLMAAVRELAQHRKGLTSPDTALAFPCAVIYGARTPAELVYHEDLCAAMQAGAISRYTYTLSREDDAKKGGCHVTDVLRQCAEEVRRSLLEENGRLFACGPAQMLRSVRQLLQTTILSEADDDESVCEQRVLLLADRQQILFDEWSSVSALD